jgi:hypothetical protein
MSISTNGKTIEARTYVCHVMRALQNVLMFVSDAASTLDSDDLTAADRRTVSGSRQFKL